VEILTAVAIIAILITMGVLAFKHTGGAAKTNTTKTMLQNLRGMYAEFEGQGGRTRDILNWYVNPGPPPTPVPAVLANQAYDPDNLHLYLPQDPTNPPKYGEPLYELWVTAYKVLPKLRSIPANKSVFDSIPVDHIYPKRWDPARGYQQYERVQAGPDPATGSTFYICTSAYSTGTAGVKSPDQGDSHWKADQPNLMILDAWGSPIIFVPPAGAANLTEGGNTRVVGGAPPTLNPKQAPDQKGYFMSAGEDRNMSQGDDNVYSFENK
jgi:type II secretory pathway pseudopilin PulG